MKQRELVYFVLGVLVILIVQQCLLAGPSVWEPQLATQPELRAFGTNRMLTMSQDGSIVLMGVNALTAAIERRAKHHGDRGVDRANNRYTAAKAHTDRQHNAAIAHTNNRHTAAIAHANTRAPPGDYLKRGWYYSFISGVEDNNNPFQQTVLRYTNTRKRAPRTSTNDYTHEVGLNGRLDAGPSVLRRRDALWKFV